MIRTNSAAFKKLGVTIVFGALLAIGFFAGRFSVNRDFDAKGLLKTSRSVMDSDNQSGSPLALRLAVPTTDASTDDRQIFSFLMGLSR